MAMVKGADKVVKADGFVSTTLKEVMKEMNGAGILVSPLKTVGKTKEAMVSDFMLAIEGIPQGSDEEKKIPVDATKLYNDFVDVIEDKKIGLEKSSVIVEPMKKETDKGEPLVKVKGSRAKEVPPGHSGKKNEFGHIIGSQAAKIDEMLIKGANLKDIVSAISSSIGRVRSHISHLRTVKGLIVEVDSKDIWKIKA